MLQYIIIAWIALAAVSGGYFYYSQNKIESLVQDAIILESQLSNSSAGLEMCEIAKATSMASMNKLVKDNQKISQDINKYLEVFKRHDLRKLAEVKPGLVEDRVNTGTAKLLKELEDETSTTN